MTFEEAIDHLNATVRPGVPVWQIKVEAVHAVLQKVCDLEAKIETLWELVAK